MNSDKPNCLGMPHEFTSNYRGDKLEDFSKFSWGTFEPFTSFTRPGTQEYYIPDYLCGSDYSGGTVKLANFKCFLDMYKNQLGVSMWELFGGHGTFGIAINWDKATDDMKETLNALDDYPCISDDELSETELELENEAWDSYLRCDFTRALNKKFTSEQEEETIDNFSDEELFTLFSYGMEKTNTYYQHEGSQGPYVDIGRIVAGLTSLLVPDPN